MPGAAVTTECCLPPRPMSDLYVTPGATRWDRAAAGHAEYADSSDLFWKMAWRELIRKRRDLGGEQLKLRSKRQK